MEGGGGLDNHQDNDMEQNGTEWLKDEENKPPTIPDIGFTKPLEHNGKMDILFKQEYFVSAASIYQMTRESRDLYVSRGSIRNLRTKFHNDE